MAVTGIASKTGKNEGGGIMSEIYKSIPTNVRLLGEFLAGKTNPITEKDFTESEIEEIKRLVSKKQKENELLENNIRSFAEQNSPFQKRTRFVYNTDTPNKSDLIEEEYYINYKADEFSPEEITRPEVIEEQKEELKQALDSFDKTSGKTAVNRYYDRDVYSPGLAGTISRLGDPKYNIQTSLGEFVAVEQEDGTVQIIDTYNFNPDEFPAEEIDLQLFLEQITNPQNVAEMLARKFRPKHSRDVRVTLDNDDDVSNTVADLLQMESDTKNTSAEPSDEFSDIPREMNKGGGLMFNEYNQLTPIPQQMGVAMRQGGGIQTEAGKDMAQNKFQLDRDKADLNKDGKLSEYEKARGEAVQRAMGEGKENKMAMGGMMVDPFAPFQVTVAIDEESGNEVPAGSKDEEVRDDIPAMLSEGEYVVPADVVRWHGLKTFEALRGEAKHALGLMAMHDRISFVDDETKEPVEYEKEEEYEIEEEDKPEVEEAEVKVIEAQEGTDVQPADGIASPSSFYQLQYRFNPNTGRTEMVYVDPLTGQPVSSDAFEQERASRFAPQETLEREVFGRAIGDDAQQQQEDIECPEGYRFDEDTQSCVPEAVTTTPEGGDGRDGQEPASDVPYSEQLTTRIAERLGGLGAEDLADFEGDTLAEQALGRMTDERGVGLARAGAAMAAGPLGIIGLGVKNVYDSVGAKRAAITRADELQNIALGLDATALPQTYNLTFDPDTASFRATSSSRITELQERKSGGVWASDYTHTDLKGNEIDPFSSDEAFDAFLDAVDAESAAMRGVTGRSGSSGVSVSVTTGDNRQTSTADTSSVTGSSDTDSPGAGGGGFGSTREGQEMGAEANPDRDDGGFGLAKGGMPARKNKPRVALMNYKGSK